MYIDAHTHKHKTDHINQLLDRFMNTTAGKSLLVVYFKLGFPGKEMQTSSGLGKFHLALNCIFSKRNKGREIFEHGSADNMAPPQNYNHIQVWMMSKSNQKHCHATLPLVRGFRVANTSC